MNPYHVVKMKEEVKIYSINDAKKIQSKNNKCEELIKDADNLELDKNIINIYKDFLRIFIKDAYVKDNKVECPVLSFENLTYLYVAKLMYEDNKISLNISLMPKSIEMRSNKCINLNDMAEVSFMDYKEIAEILYSVCYQKSSTKQIASELYSGFDQRKLFN